MLNYKYSEIFGTTRMTSVSYPIKYGPRTSVHNNAGSHKRVLIKSDIGYCTKGC